MQSFTRVGSRGEHALGLSCSQLQGEGALGSTQACDHCLIHGFPGGLRQLTTSSSLVHCFPCVSLCFHGGNFGSKRMRHPVSKADQKALAGNAKLLYQYMWSHSRRGRLAILREGKLKHSCGHSNLLKHFSEEELVELPKLEIIALEDGPIQSQASGPVLIVLGLDTRIFHP